VSPQGEELRLAGTGTLVTLGGFYYVLTAAHVWEEVLKSSSKIGITLMEDRDHAFLMDTQTIVPSGPLKPASWNSWGPDLVYLRIPLEYLGSINARHLFYGAAVDGKTSLNVSHIEVWVLLGTPGVLGKFTQNHADVEIRGFFANTDKPSETKGDLDYCDVGVDDLPSASQYYGGVSGGGLWKVLLHCSCPEGKVEWLRSLEGVAFYQLGLENGHQMIRCHGPKSILVAAPPQ
jgi:hypothetical protein